MTRSPAPADCATGMKILPPARKLPFLPLMAITVGSARIFTKPSVFCASTVTVDVPVPAANGTNGLSPTRASPIWPVKTLVA